MLVKRLVVIIVSMVVAALITAGIVTLLLGTTVAEYGPTYFTLTTFFLGCAIALVIDRFAGTEMLPK